VEGKKGRYPADHPRAGGYFVMWAKQTLDSEKLRNPLIAGCFFKVLAVAQLIDGFGGKFEKGGVPFAAISIANRDGITGEQFSKLVDIGLIAKEARNGEVFYSIKSWEEHQNPKVGDKGNYYCTLKAEKNAIKKPNIGRHIPSSFILHPSSLSLHPKSLQPKRKYKNQVVQSKTEGEKHG